jgi:pilus assembly protein CpaE
MEEVARVVLALEEHDVAEEVMHFLDRTGRARVVATASDEHQLSEAVRQLEPDAVVASPRLASSAQLNGSALLAVDTSESVQTLRRAIQAGAMGFFLWPADRGELARATARAFAPHARDRSVTPARVVAVCGSRGGAGATFLATHLAAGFARRDQRCVLVDLDLGSADVGPALGAPIEGSLRTIADAVPMGDELTPRHLDDLLWDHPDGFRVLLAPGDVHQGERIATQDVGPVLEAVRETADIVVLLVARGLDEPARLAFRLADLVLMVLQLDVMSFRAAKRAVEATAIQDRCSFVVNRAARREISPDDVERVFGREPIAVIPSDRRVPAAQDRGRLLPARSRAGRSVDRLAGKVLERLEEGS